MDRRKLLGFGLAGIVGAGYRYLRNENQEDSDVANIREKLNGKLIEIKAHKQELEGMKKYLIANMFLISDIDKYSSRLKEIFDQNYNNFNFCLKLTEELNKLLKKDMSNGAQIAEGVKISEECERSAGSVFDLAREIEGIINAFKNDKPKQLIA